MNLFNPEKKCKGCGKIINQSTAKHNDGWYGYCDDCANAFSEDADREMFGDEAEFLPDDMGCK